MAKRSTDTVKSPTIRRHCVTIGSRLPRYTLVSVHSFADLLHYYYITYIAYICNIILWTRASAKIKTAKIIVKSSIRKSLVREQFERIRYIANLWSGDCKVTRTCSKLVSRSQTAFSPPFFLGDVIGRGERVWHLSYTRFRSVPKHSWTAEE